MKKKDKKKSKLHDNIFDDTETDGNGMFSDLFSVFSRYTKGMGKLPWKELPKEGYFLIFMVVSFMIIIFTIYKKII